MQKSKTLLFLVLIFCCFRHNYGNLLSNVKSCNKTVFWDTLEAFNTKNLLTNIYFNNNLCGEHLKELVAGASNGTLWALKMFDASGKYPGKLFTGNEYWLGSKNLCSQLQIVQNSTKQQNYRRTFENRLIIDNEYNVNAIPPYDINFNVVTVFFKFNLCPFENITVGNPIYIGLCLPSACNTVDIKIALRNIITQNTLIEIVHIRNIKREINVRDVWGDVRFYLLSFFIISSSILMTLGTILDYFSFKNNKIETKKWYKILKAFSLKRNLQSIFSFEIGEDTLAPIHGLKFLSMVWVILVHSCLMLFQVAENKKFRDQVESNVFYQTISNGTYSVDTFFTLSGVLVSFLFFRTTLKYPIKTLVGKDGIIGHIYLYLSMLIYRFIRLSFPYIVVIILTGFVTEQKMKNSPLILPNKDHINCAKYWWRNVLYINTFYPVNQMCMIWSWYLSNDTQFFILGVPLLLTAIRYKIIAFCLASIYLIVSWVTTGIISYQTQHVIDIRDPFANYDELYDKPWTRVGPYLIGMITGWILFRNNCCLKINKSVCYILWMCSLLTMIFIIYGPLYFGISLSFGIFYSSFSHSLWSISVSWILIACVTNNGFWIGRILSWRYMYPLSRISYCAYLIHPLIIRMTLLSSENPFYLSVEIVAALFFGILIITFIFATILSLAFESPIVSLLRLGYPGRK